MSFYEHMGAMPNHQRKSLEVDATRFLEVESMATNKIPRLEGRVDFLERMTDRLATALHDLTHEETCTHHWCVTGREALEEYNEDKERRDAEASR